MKKVDYIIVGLGLAGACLAIQLLRRGKRIVVYDVPSKNRASSVAAGLFNPITGKRIVKTWKADETFSYLEKFYDGIEKEFKCKFFFPTQLYTPFRSIEEQNEWMGRSADPSFSGYIMEVTTSPTFSDQVDDPLGGIILSRSGYINTKVLLETLRHKLLQDQSYYEEEFEEGKLLISNNNIQYKDLTAQKIILCTGIHQLDSKSFRGLPLKPLKGEVLSIKTTVQLNRIYNRGVYVIESGDLEYKVGATYDLENPVAGTTNAGRAELERKVKEFLSIPFKVTHQDWGIRPSTIDRRPILGTHPNLKNLVIFNGLGTKGVSLAPYFSDQLAKYLLGEGNLDDEVNISRVKALYSELH